MSNQFFFYSDAAKSKARAVVESLPSECEVYLVGGTIRNALIKKYHGETWVQRDYDQITTRKNELYIAHLKQHGFVKGTIDDPLHKVFTKPSVNRPREGSYEDNIVFEIHNNDGTTPEENLRHYTGLSINGFMLSLRDMFREDWEQRLIQLPNALESLKNKQIRVNKFGYSSEKNYLFACLRFVGKGFAAPPEDELHLLFAELPTLSSERYQRNLKKLSSYLGGEQIAREVARSMLGESVDIFDEDATKLYAQHLFGNRK